MTRQGRSSILTALLILIVASVANAAPRGYNGGSGGAPCTLANRCANVKAYGAAVDGVLVHDASFTAATPFTNGISAAPQAGAVNVAFANSIVVTVMGTGTNLTPPPGPTQRLLLTTTLGYGAYAGDTLVSTPGPFAAQTGSISSSSWSAANIILAPKSLLALITTGTGSAWTSTAQCAASANCTLAIPSNATAGDLILGCDIFYNDNLTQTPPFGASASKLDLVGYIARASDENHFCFSRYMVAGDTNLSFTATAFSGHTAWIRVYKNAKVYGSSMHSSGASFTTADINKRYCLESSGIFGYAQTCGPIADVIDAHDIALSFYPSVTVGAGGLLDFGYGTDDTNAWYQAVAALMPLGGRVFTPGISVTTSDIIIPSATIYNGVGVGYSWIFEGTGGAIESLFLSPTYYPGTPQSGIMALTTTGIINGVIETTSGGTRLVVKNMVIMGGVGFNEDGGSPTADGINANATGTHAQLDSVVITNMGHDCVDAPSSGQPWGGVSINHSILTSCGNYCDDMPGTGSQGVVITANMMQQCGNTQNSTGGGIYVNGQGVLIAGNTIQDQASTRPNFVFGPGETGIGTPASGEVIANYSEGTPWFVLSANMVGYKWENNVYLGGTTPLQEIFSAATVQLPAATKYGYYAGVCVSDAAALTLGATYTPSAGAGSVHALVQSNKTNWIIVGGCP